MVRYCSKYFYDLIRVKGPNMDEAFHAPVRPENPRQINYACTSVVNVLTASNGRKAMWVVMTHMNTEAIVTVFKMAQLVKGSGRLKL